jgi:5-formyltetrahydrofolate cyclo-ligase
MANRKQIIREEVAKLQQSLPDKTVAALSRKICNFLIKSDALPEVKCIALYYPMDKEVQVTKLIEKYYLDIKIVLPVVTGDQIHFYQYTGKANLRKGPFGIPEPDSGEITPPEDIDVFFVPGIAFDRACNRLGRGKGYYDRYLSGLTDKFIIGLCFDFQVFERLPTGKHDKKMSLVITETRVLFNKQLLRNYVKKRYNRETTSSTTQKPPSQHQAAEGAIV